VDVAAWRTSLAEAAARSLDNPSVAAFVPEGPFHTVVTLREGAAVARRLGSRWGIEHHGPRLFFTAADHHQLFYTLTRICYLTPVVERTLSAGMFLYRLLGRAGLAWVRLKERKETPCT
jgi:hypothetical protein